MQIYNISRKKHEKNGTFFSGIGDWRIGDGGAEGEGQGGEIAQHFEIFGIIGQKHFEIFGKRVGMEFSSRIAKKMEKQQGTHRNRVDALWFIALSGFREFNRSFDHSKIMHCALCIVH
ncbi:MAG: hypothetical protein IJM66_02755 [Muribaculaceae bacterium]|nr:hypothetical protein [Muribaculaceae bacterium]